MIPIEHVTDGAIVEFNDEFHNRPPENIWPDDKIINEWRVGFCSDGEHVICKANSIKNRPAYLRTTRTEIASEAVRVIRPTVFRLENIHAGKNVVIENAP